MKDKNLVTNYSFLGKTKLKKNSAIIVIDWNGEVYRKGILFDMVDFRKKFPKLKPFKQMDNIDNDFSIKRHLDALFRSTLRTILFKEKIAHYDPKFDFKGYKAYLIKKKK